MTEANKITINVEKSKTLIFGNRKTQHGRAAATLGSQVLERVQDYKYLGVKLDNELNYNLRISNVIQKVNKIWVFLLIFKDKKLFD